ncbi:ribbon-helix-helix domain-containing protein [Massilia endophytica]|uniref:ribbon-helix-helix domain-containing protein n=1 Tax=Massilia endophytica TaxID=2899220 RepID=UPI001E331624|nr:type II toxin-antitoxin system ParD family antitoxin [Massilia endophytica]UGQ46704.1 type II toxin-antitoxin system ParD family antitoxin [Massilia endophytica]
MPTLTISLSDHLSNYIVSKCQDQPALSADDLVAEGLRLLEERDRQLRDFVAQGADSGTPEPGDEAFDRLQQKYQAALQDAAK